MRAGRGGRNGAEGAARGTARFGIEGLELASAAGEPEEDDALVLATEVAGPEFVVTGFETAETDAERGGDAALEEGAAIYFMFRRCAVLAY